MPPSRGDATIRPDHSMSTVGGIARIVPALTIIWHPDLDRVGEHTVLTDLAEGKKVTLSRLGPLFKRPGSDRSRDLEALYLSRTPALELCPGVRGQIELRPGPAGAELEVQGAPLALSTTLTPAEIENGVIITVARHFAFCLHHVRWPVEHGPNLGLIGHGQALERVRQDVRRVADLDVPVLIRGETGTGKELVARSVVACSKRADRPFIAVNMATIPAAMAAAELFGHEKGAFTGAAAARSGYFGEAAGGTLFLDEVGLTPPDVQAMLLRVLETGEVQALGSGRTRKLDVRVLAATDLQLESAIAKNAFSEPLFQRLAGFQIRLPPLRKRREDFGELVLHFLKQELALTGELDRLIAAEDRKPWLSATKVARLANGSWSGNVRALRNAVRQIVIASRGEARAVIDASVEELADAHTGTATPTQATLEAAARAAGVPGARRRPSAPAAIAPAPPPERARSMKVGDRLDVGSGDDDLEAMPWEISNELLLETLREHNWSPTHTAAALKIPRTKLYALMDRHPEIRKASEIAPADLLRLHRELGGNLDAMADHLRVSRRGLQLRMAQLVPGVR
jgi:two-component system, NtrC family, nitrogen regulation response regulator GlnG